MLRRPSWIKQSIATSHPSLYPIAVTFRRIERRVELWRDPSTYASTRIRRTLPVRVKKHQSVLIRKLSSFEDQTLQHNKIENLRIVVSLLDGLCINPQEVFSFYKIIGKPTARRGFKEGMQLSKGQPQKGVGGGICQITNLIYWLVLHSPLNVVERHHHSFDPFPDQGRVLPFASGASVMYNYRDLRFHNPTPHVFQFRFWLDAKCLNGDLRCSHPLRYSYSVYEKNHRYEKVGGKTLRKNELWRRVIDKEAGGITVRHEHLVSNCGEVKYPVNF